MFSVPQKIYGVATNQQGQIQEECAHPQLGTSTSCVMGRRKAIGCIPLPTPKEGGCAHSRAECLYTELCFGGEKIKESLLHLKIRTFVTILGFIRACSRALCCTWKCILHK